MEYDTVKGEGQVVEISMDPHRCRLGADCHLMRMPEVLALVNVAKSTLHAWIAVGLFPSQVQVGPRAVRWRACEVYDWLATRPPVRPSPTTLRGRVRP